MPFSFLLKTPTMMRQAMGYGLTIDHTDNKEIASIASVGFTLSAYIIGVTLWLYGPRRCKKIKVIKTLGTLRDKRKSL